MSYAVCFFNDNKINKYNLAKKGRRIKMKRHIFLFVILSVLMATTVLAQSNAYGPDPSYNWRGLYFGVQGSYHTGNSNWDEPFGGFRISHDIEGGMGGFYIGYNFQTPYHFVFGIETEMSFGSVDGSSSCPTQVFHVIQM